MSTSICLWCVFLLFKQKTAYEMRISDWSSDVCSSDLLRALCGGQQLLQGAENLDALDRVDAEVRFQICIHCQHFRRIAGALGDDTDQCGGEIDRRRDDGDAAGNIDRYRNSRRSEEHTSELQSLMRISYAVFCLKNKKNK